jgi:GNAT superfamily N-acetyltransferase
MRNVALLRIRSIEPEDAEKLSEAFRAIGWSKPAETFDRYAVESEAGARWVRVAEWDGSVAGYVTLLWESDDPLLRKDGIPEVKDLNVLPRFRCSGIGNALLEEVEAEARTRGHVLGLRVGLHSGYGAAQRLYARRGYLPDGSGAWESGAPVEEGALIRMGDDVTLRMVKRI